MEWLCTGIAFINIYFIQTFFIINGWWRTLFVWLGFYYIWDLLFFLLVVVFNAVCVSWSFMDADEKYVWNSAPASAVWKFWQIWDSIIYCFAGFCFLLFGWIDVFFSYIAAYTLDDLGFGKQGILKSLYFKWNDLSIIIFYIMMF